MKEDEIDYAHADMLEAESSIVPEEPRPDTNTDRDAGATPVGGNGRTSTSRPLSSSSLGYGLGNKPADDIVARIKELKTSKKDMPSDFGEECHLQGMSEMLDAVDANYDKDIEIVMNNPNYTPLEKEAVLYWLNAEKETLSAWREELEK